MEAHYANGIIAQGVVKHFGSEGSKLPILKGIDMIANSGEVIAILGRSGSGKTTFLSLLGALAPDVSVPRMWILPPDGRSSAPSKLKKVVFPDPDRPNIAMTSPEFAIISIPLSMGSFDPSLPKCLTTPWAIIPLA
jgi:ABC-type phosphate/phosphonate transport system ATPase subunit